MLATPKRRLSVPRPMLPSGEKPPGGKKVVWPENWPVERRLKLWLNCLMSTTNTSTNRKPATPSYWKSPEEIAMLLLQRGCKTAVSAKVLASLEARIETHQKLGYKPSR